MYCKSYVYNYYALGSHVLVPMVTSMLVTDVGDQMCW